MELVAHFKVKLSYLDHSDHLKHSLFVISSSLIKGIVTSHEPLPGKAPCKGKGLRMVTSALSGISTSGSSSGRSSGTASLILILILLLRPLVIRTGGRVARVGPADAGAEGPGLGRRGVAGAAAAALSAAGSAHFRCGAHAQGRLADRGARCAAGVARGGRAGALGCLGCVVTGVGHVSGFLCDFVVCCNVVWFDLDVAVRNSRSYCYIFEESCCRECCFCVLGLLVDGQRKVRL